MLSVGPKLKSIRQAKGLTIQELANKTNLSKSFLCNIERGNTSPSLASLEKIARTLGMPLTFFFLTDDVLPRVVKPQQRHRAAFAHDGRTVEFISARPGGEIEMFILDIPVRQPGQAEVTCHRHKGEECHYVLSGKLEVYFGHDRFEVEAGDSFHWDGTVPHKVENIGDEPARLIVSLMPPSFFTSTEEPSQASRTGSELWAE
jgi:transcriptional regulator with XRE-family HTH domain